MKEERPTAIELDHAIDRMLRGELAPVETEPGPLLGTARLVREALPPFHPRFGFEEHLARRLAAASLSARASAASPTPIRPRMALTNADLPVLAASTGPAGSVTVGPGPRRRGLVAGGAIASGVSIAGAALVVWRRSRSGGLF